MINTIVSSQYRPKVCEFRSPSNSCKEIELRIANATECFEEDTNVVALSIKTSTTIYFRTLVQAADSLTAASALSISLIFPVSG